IPTSSLRSMRYLSQIVRTSLKSGAILVLMLLAASSAEAAHRSHHTGAGRRATAARAVTLKQFKRTPHSFGGPVALPSQRLLGGPVARPPNALRGGPNDRRGRARRATGADEDDAASAIKNDARAARGDPETRGVPLFFPPALLAPPPDPRLSAGTYSPKSPRGP